MKYGRAIAMTQSMLRSVSHFKRKFIFFVLHENHSVSAQNFQHNLWVKLEFSEEFQENWLVSKLLSIKNCLKKCLLSLIIFQAPLAWSLQTTESKNTYAMTL